MQRAVFIACLTFESPTAFAGQTDVQKDRHICGRIAASEAT
jgi:hypothetical protein